MKRILLAVFILVSIRAISQEQKEPSIFDGRSWGIVVDDPGMKKVVVKQDVTYLSDAQGTLKMDVYLPPDLAAGDKRPAIVFLNAIGDRPGEPKVKSWGTYRTWPRFVAANGYVGISMECDGNRVQESLAAIFDFLNSKGSDYNVDPGRLGVYAASANVTQSVIYLMKPNAFPGIKAAALYYGGQPAGPYRKDLPVLFIIAESDVSHNGYSTLWNEVLKNNAPWTIQMGSGLIHAFDSFSDNADSRKVIRETMSFWKNHLEPDVRPSWPMSIGRETLAAQYGHQPEKVANLLKQYLTTHPEDPEALFFYGHVMLSLRRYAEAEGSLLKGLLYEPGNVAAQTNLIAVDYALNKDAEAEKRLAKIVQSGVATRDTYSALGMILFILDRHKEGVKQFEKAVALGAYHWDYYNLACGYARLHETDKAFAALVKSVELGMKSKEQIERDSDLESLRSDSRYKDLLRTVQ